ncbi:hypothetical protein LWI28_007513 [Acer negundo]|uniref:C3H1-type domain-containing protein n=1 Tax=Acer negundo TaxID=4023 RepID=A0AAD5ILT1_ACENE|nr:hypothetical protein LWI28_007513 [Acer negundo]
MVVAAQQVQEQQQPQTSTTTSPEEEILKRNTDCVYFLASPLTCKKGSECEYRHSEYARVNPRDCYFWLNGNCLNPKCGFRHPPLDGLLGTQTATSTAASFVPSHSATPPTTHTPQGSGKQAVPCIFFQKGLCLKGDRCAFLHGPNPTINKAPQPAAAAPATEPPSLKKTSGFLQRCTQEQKVPPANVSKAVVVPPQANKPAPKAETALPRNGLGIQRAPPPSAAFDEFPRYKAANVTPVVNGSSMSRSNRFHQAHASDDQGFQTGKEADEFLRESSPGFDVLVDDELGDSDYYHGEDQYGRTGGHEDMNLNSVNEFDVGGLVDYNSLADIDRDTLRDPRGYDSYDRMQGQYAWEQHTASSERVLVGPSHLERKSYSKAESPDQIDESDLRYRLSKSRRGNGLRSVVSLDHASDKQVEERSHRGSSRRDLHHVSSQESSLSSRLRGRIKLPRRSPVSGNDVRPERETDRGRSRGQLSPGKTQTSHQGKLRDRIKGRVDEDYNNEGRNLRGPLIRREIMDEGNIDFAAPKRLSQLKVGNNAESKDQQILGKRKGLEYNHPSEGGLSFDGPMPLSEILKRKREAREAASSSGISSHKNQKESSYNTGVASVQSAVSNLSKGEANNKEELKSAKAEEEKIEVTHGLPSQLPNGSEVEAEDGMIGDEVIEDHELDGDDQRDGDYEYEQGEEGEYNYEEGENADAEEEYLDEEEEEEDGDDFAKKIGVMFS